jgi:hypothetical protein
MLCLVLLSLVTICTSQVIESQNIGMGPSRIYDSGAKVWGDSPFYSEDLTGCRAQKLAWYDVRVKFNHIVSYSTMQHAWDKLLQIYPEPGNVAVTCLSRGFTTTLDAISYSLEIHRLKSKDGSTADVDGVRKLVAKIRDGKIKHDPSKTKTNAWKDALMILEYPPGNIFMGPYDRADPGSDFDTDAEHIVTPQHYALLQEIQTRLEYIHKTMRVCDEQYVIATSALVARMITSGLAPAPISKDHWIVGRPYTINKGYRCYSTQECVTPYGMGDTTQSF